MRPPGGGPEAGVAWMDTRLLTARLYSGSVSPGGGPWHFTAPIAATQARTLVAAFNGGFKMPVSGGGYYSEGRVASPLRAGAASLVINRDGSVWIGSWTGTSRLGSQIVAVRQNLRLIVDHHRPVPGLNPADNSVWGATLGGSPDVWRSGLGETSDGALVYVAGPSLNVLTLAELLARAGAVRAMTLDMNPYWTAFATYAPEPGQAASPANGTDLLASMVGQPNRFFTAWWARDFVTMSAR